jgi:hypothetical protein
MERIILLGDDEKQEKMIDPHRVCDKCISLISDTEIEQWLVHIKKEHHPGDVIPFGANITDPKEILKLTTFDIIDNVNRYTEEIVDLFLHEGKTLLTFQQQRLLQEWHASWHYRAGFPAHLNQYNRMAIALAYALGRLDERGREMR